MKLPGNWPNSGADNSRKPTAEYAKILCEEAEELLAAGKAPEASELFAQSRKIYHDLYLKDLEAAAIEGLARCQQRIGALDEARRLLEDALAIYRERASRRNIGLVLDQIGSIALIKRNFSYARRMLTESTNYWDSEAQKGRLAASQYLLSAASLGERDRLASADLETRAGIASCLARESMEIAEAMLELAIVVLERDLPDLQRAHRLIEESLRQYRCCGFSASIVPALTEISKRLAISALKAPYLEFASALRAIYAGARNNAPVASALLMAAKCGISADGTTAAYSIMKECLAISQDPRCANTRPFSYIELGIISWLEQHVDLARSFYEKGYAAIRDLRLAPADELDLMLQATQRIYEVEDLKAAALHFARAAAQAKHKGSVGAYVHAVCYRAAIEVAQGDFENAARHAEECLLLHDGVPGGTNFCYWGRALICKGAALAGRGDVVKGREIIAKGLAGCKDDKDTDGTVMGLRLLGSIVPIGSDLRDERQALTECIELCEFNFCRMDAAMSRSELAHHLLAGGATNDACRAFLQSSLFCGREGNIAALTSALEGCAIAGAERRQYREVIPLLGAAEELRSRVGASNWYRKLEVDAICAMSRAEIGEAEFTDLYESGARMSRKDTILAVWEIVASRGS